MGITKPKAIIDNIGLNNKSNVEKLTIPLIRDLNNYLASLRKSVGGNTNLNLGELAQWCLDHVTIPEDPNQAFVVCYKAFFPDDTLPGDHEPNDQLRFFLTSKRLIEFSSHAKLVIHEHEH